jgi:hypothetical protein
MPAPDRNRHSTDPDRDRVTPERSEMEWLDNHAFIEAEMPEPTRFGLIEKAPVDRQDMRPRPDLELVEIDGLRLKERNHSCD